VGLGHVVNLIYTRNTANRGGGEDCVGLKHAVQKGLIDKDLIILRENGYLYPHWKEDNKSRRKCLGKSIRDYVISVGLRKHGLHPSRTECLVCSIRLKS
jgi:hypothetical protein